MGQSGAGKSTLLHLLGGLDRPSGGEVIFGDRDIVSLGEQELASFRNNEIGFVWQNPSLLAEFTALENVMMPLLIRGEERAGGYQNGGRPVSRSGVRRARFASRRRTIRGRAAASGLARALVTGPHVLLADEPTGNLDFRTGETIIALLNDLHAAHGLTSVVVTHNLSFASRCDRVLELKKGGLYPVSKRDCRKPESYRTQPVWTVALMFERYTEKARRVIFFARYEASQFGSPYIETEHLLLGSAAGGQGAC